MKKFIPPLIIVLAGIFLAFNLLRPGFMQTHDGIWHIERLLSMTSMLKLGQFPVRWSFGLDNGFGLPVFNFVYPGPYYFMSILHLFGVGVVATLKLTNLFFYLLGGLGFFFLFKNKSKFLAVSAALLYLLTPYHFLDLFVRGALGEVVVLGLVPWCFLALQTLRKTKRLSWYTSLPLFLILISHNFLGLLFLGLILFFTILLYDQKKLVLKSIIVSVGLSSFFLLPMLSERKLLLSSPPDLPNTQFANHYVYPSQLIYSPWNYAGSLPGNNPLEISYQLGYANILLILMGLWLFYKYFKKKQASLSLLPLIIILVSLFLMTPASSIFWDTFSFLKIIQFPWRLLAISALLFPLVFIELFSSSPFKKWQYLLPPLLVFIAFLNTANVRSPEFVLSESAFSSLHAAYATKFASAYRYELTPRWAPVERAHMGTLSLSSGGAKITNLKEGIDNIAFTAESSSSTVITINRNYFPSWKAKGDGQALPLIPAPDGSISLTLLPGTHSYRLYVGSTNIEILGNIISIVSLSGIIYLMLRKKLNE